MTDRSSLLSLPHLISELSGNTEAGFVLSNHAIYYSYSICHFVQSSVQKINNCSRIWFFDKNSKLQAFVGNLVGELTMTPTVHFGKKHPITKLKTLRKPLMVSGRYKLQLKLIYF